METQIPKQVRDDNVRDTREGERGVTVFADSENVGLNLFYHLGLESRCSLRSMNPLYADENHLPVNGTASPPINTGSSFRRCASRFFVLG
jgi:hypothetical protein